MFQWRVVKGGTSSLNLESKTIINEWRSYSQVSTMMTSSYRGNCDLWKERTRWYIWVGKSKNTKGSEMYKPVLFVLHGVDAMGVKTRRRPVAHELHSYNKKGENSSERNQAPGNHFKAYQYCILHPLPTWECPFSLRLMILHLPSTELNRQEKLMDPDGHTFSTQTRSLPPFGVPALSGNNATAPSRTLSWVIKDRIRAIEQAAGVLGRG